MSSALRRQLGRYIPVTINNPVSLAWRLIRSKNPGARFALGLAAVGLLLTPLDMLLGLRETAELRRAAGPRRPMLIVVGPPRSGTTLLTQVLINHLDVSYFCNLTALFPQAPITAGRWLPKPPAAQTYDSFYGRTRGLTGVSDALPIWDRWLGQDRHRIPQQLVNEQAMLAFFGAWERAYVRPLVCKINRLDAAAHLVADALAQTTFICLHRSPLWLAQSLLRAREQIHGDLTSLYGVSYPGRSDDKPANVVDDVCRQVAFHQEMARQQRERLGAERFWLIDYEQFCENPRALVSRAARHLNVATRGLEQLTTFSASTQATLAEPLLTELATRLDELLPDTPVIDNL